MPKGGARIGAGRKPRQAEEMASTSAPFQPVVVRGAKSGSDVVPMQPPDGLTGEALGFWERTASFAQGARTLAPQTLEMFQVLCRLYAEMVATQDTIERDGRTFLKVTVDGAGQEHQELKSHPLMGHYRQLAKQIEVLMARFSLAPLGKPVAGTKAPRAKDWLDELTG